MTSGCGGCWRRSAAAWVRRTCRGRRVSIPGSSARWTTSWAWSVGCLASTSRPASCATRSAWASPTPLSPCLPTVRRSRCGVCGGGGASGRSTRWWTPAPPSSKRRPPISTAPTRKRTKLPRWAGGAALRGRKRAHPHRPRDRVRLLLGPRRVGAARRGRQEHRGQFESGDGLHRLRHQRPALLRTAGRGERARHPGERGSRGGRRAVLPALDRAVRRANGDQPVPDARPGPAPILGSTARSIDIASDRHLFEEFLAGLGIPNPPGAAVANLEQALIVAQSHRLPDPGAPQLRPRRSGHGDRAERRRAGEVHEAGARGRRRPPGADRPLPRRPRGGRGRHLRRRDGTHPRPYGAHRTRRSPQRRLDGDLPWPDADRGRSRYDGGLHHPHRPRAAGEGADERAVRAHRRGGLPQPVERRRRQPPRGVRSRSEPSGQPDGALPLEGDRRPHGEGGRQGHAGPEPRGAGIPAGAVQAAQARRREGAGVLDVEAGRRRHLPRP